MKNTPTYIAVVQYGFQFPLPPSMQTVLPELLQSLAVKSTVYLSNDESHYIANFLGTS